MALVRKTEQTLTLDELIQQIRRLSPDQQEQMRKIMASNLRSLRPSRSSSPSPSPSPSPTRTNNHTPPPISPKTQKKEAQQKQLAMNTNDTNLVATAQNVLNNLLLAEASRVIADRSKQDRAQALVQGIKTGEVKSTAEMKKNIDDLTAGPSMTTSSAFFSRKKPTTTYQVLTIFQKNLEDFIEDFQHSKDSKRVDPVSRKYLQDEKHPGLAFKKYLLDLAVRSLFRDYDATSRPSAPQVYFKMFIEGLSKAEDTANLRRRLRSLIDNLSATNAPLSKQVEKLTKHIVTDFSLEEKGMYEYLQYKTGLSDELTSIPSPQRSPRANRSNA